MQFIPLILLTAIAIAGFYLVSETEYKNLGRILIVICSAFVVAFVVYVCYLLLAFATENILFYSLMLAVIGIAFVGTIAVNLWDLKNKKRIYFLLGTVSALCVASLLGHYGYKVYVEHIPVISEKDSLWAEYIPYAKGSKVAVLDEQPDLILSGDLPSMDGGTALYPVYSAFARAVYPEAALRLPRNEYLKCSKTPGAYERLILGEADIIFVPVPSEEQLQSARDMGVELVCTPFLKEAFVFFVNKNNPAESLTIGQLQGIYSGRITQWSQLGVSGLGDIKAFQRNEGSVSQRALELFMAGAPLMKPPVQDVLSDVGVIVSRAADYKNLKNSIGFSFRFYTTEMIKNHQIKLLNMNGTEPSVANIEDGTYPASAYFYAVTRSDMSENTRRLLEWITGEQGQKLVEMTGYATVK